MDAWLRPYIPSLLHLQVSLRRLGPASLDVDVMAWFVVEPEAFARLRSDVLLQILEVVEHAGATLASPPQPLQLLREQK